MSEGAANDIIITETTKSHMYGIFGIKIKIAFLQRQYDCREAEMHDGLDKSECSAYAMSNSSSSSVFSMLRRNELAS